MNTHYLIKQWGKNFIRDLLEIIVISQKTPPNEDFRKILLKHNIIKPTTKQIYCYFSHYNHTGRWWIVVRNGRGTYIVDMYIYDSEIPELIKLVS